MNKMTKGKGDFITYTTEIDKIISKITINSYMLKIWKKQINFGFIQPTKITSRRYTTSKQIDNKQQDRNNN